MSATEITHESWLGRIAGSFKKILFGGVLFLAAFPLLFWNEGRAVRRAKTLAAGRGAVLENVTNDAVNSANDGALVHMTGEAMSSETLEDAVFGVTVANAIKLQRIVEMYQWDEEVHHESKKKIGGGRKRYKTYSYRTLWSEEAIDSSKFDSRGKGEYGAGNPPMPLQSKTLNASVVCFGGFELSERQVARIESYEVVPIEATDLANIPDRQLATKLKLHKAGLYQGETPTEPQIGDLRIHFKLFGKQPVSLVAKQQGNSFVPFEFPKGSIDLFESGELTADQLFTIAENLNLLQLWLLRLGGFALMAVGIALIFQPLVVLADVVPFFGNLVGLGILIIAMMVAGVMSFVVIGFAWLFYRPLLAITLFAIAAILFWMVRKLFRKTPAEVTVGNDGIPIVE